MNRRNSLLVSFIRLYWKSGFRGSWRISEILSKKFQGLHCVPIDTENGRLFLDLRIGSARGILAMPRSLSGEDEVMRRFVRAGDTVLDVGAHLGLYTLLLSNLVTSEGAVFAFEPNPELLPSLRHTLAELENVQLFEIALSNEQGSIELFVPEDASMASLSNWTDPNVGNVRSVTCEMMVLDEMFDAGEISLPSFIKCDVEGAELSVFYGAKGILDRVEAPVVLFELNKKATESFGRKTSEYFTFFESLEKPEYRLFEVLPGSIKEIASLDMDYANIVAVPKARG